MDEFVEFRELNIGDVFVSTYGVFVYRKIPPKASSVGRGECAACKCPPEEILNAEVIGRPQHDNRRHIIESEPFPCHYCITERAKRGRYGPEGVYEGPGRQAGPGEGAS